jgi:hypothetical protein
MTRLYASTQFLTQRRSIEQTQFKRTPPHTQGLAQEAQRQAWQSLLLGRFDMARRYAETLERLANGLEADEILAFALGVRGMLACLTDDDVAHGKLLANQALALVHVPTISSNKLVLAWTSALVALRTNNLSAAQYHVAAALRDAMPINSRLGVAHLVMHALLFAQGDQPAKAVQFFALAWNNSLPDGGWLEASPYCQQTAQALQHRLGMELYRKLWVMGERLPLHATLAQLIEQYAR